MTVLRGVAGRERELFDAHRNEIYQRTDRWFAYLMCFQFLAGIVAAVVLSPRTWTGSMSQVHLHVWAAVLLGGAIAALPVTMAILWPGRVLTRMVVASGQMLASALLIHLSGGRIETHFHVFGSLAFLAFYRDWRVFIPATVVVAVDHLVRGLYWPQSVYGVLAATPWRSAEHAAWVIFENIFLIRSCLQSVREMRVMARRRAELEHAKATVEDAVRARTAELEERTRELEHEVAERARAERERTHMHSRLMQSSHFAGMAEVATGVLHNVGNVLNSVNVSTGLLTERVRNSGVGDLTQVAALLDEHRDDLGSYLVNDERGRMIPALITELGAHLTAEQHEMLSELGELSDRVDHIKGIIAVQQSYASHSGVSELVALSELAEDALRMHDAGLERHLVRVERDFTDAPRVQIDKHKMLQILINLISNAKYAVSATPEEDRVLRVRIGPADAADRARIEIIDNGIGIAAENLARIFGHGFTTRRDGHGFGLHSSALAAKALGGSLSVASDGPGRGATFTIEVPLVPPAAESFPVHSEAA